MPTLFFVYWRNSFEFYLKLKIKQKVGISKNGN